MTRETETQTPMVTLTTLDRLVGLLTVGLILFGSYSWWRATRRVRGRSGMMDRMMGTMPGMDPSWYLVGTVTAASVILGVYVISREQVAKTLSSSTTDSVTVDEYRDDQSEGSNESPSSRPSDQAEPAMAGPPFARQPSPLTFLPEDEQRVLEPVLESPGLTQVELRGRSDFSKAKVSQAISELEDRGLIYREKQGRTYRIYPGELLKDQDGA